MTGRKEGIKNKKRRKRIQGHFLHAAFRALRLSSPAYAATAASTPSVSVPARGLFKSTTAAFPATALRWNSSDSPSYGYQNNGVVATSEPRQGNGSIIRKTNYRPVRPPPQPCETVYVGNLFFDVTAEQLQAHCEQFGKVESARIIYDAR
ncbi:hypothetical protein KEM54_002459, partial [Ascosphaera aggregata]